MTKAEEILEKHLADYDTTSYVDEDRKLKQCYVNAINEALTIPVVSGSVISINEQVEIIKKVHNALDDLTLGNYELAHKQLNKIVGNEQLYIPVVVRQNEQLLAYTEWLKKEGLLNATVSKLIVKKYQSK